MNIWRAALGQMGILGAWRGHSCPSSAGASTLPMRGRQGKAFAPAVLAEGQCLDCNLWLRWQLLLHPLLLQIARCCLHNALSQTE